MSTGSNRRAVGLNPIGSLVVWKIQTVFTVILAVLAAILLEFGGMGRLWDSHEGLRLQNRTALERDLLESQVDTGLAIRMTDLIHHFYLVVIDRTLGSTGTRWESSSRQVTEGPKSMALPARVLNDVRHRIAQHTQLIGSFLREISFRVAGMTVGWIVLFFFFAIGLVDGLVRREVRRWSGGRESSWVYNTSSRLLAPTSMAYSIAVIVWPWTLNMAWTIAIFAAINGPLLSIASSRFKKYL